MNILKLELKRSILASAIVLGVVCFSWADITLAQGGNSGHGILIPNSELDAYIASGQLEADMKAYEEWLALKERADNTCKGCGGGSGGTGDGSGGGSGGSDNVNGDGPGGSNSGNGSGGSFNSNGYGGSGNSNGKRGVKQ